MFDIDNNGIITLTRGDTAQTYLFLNQGTEFSPVRFSLGDEDKIYFGIIEPNYTFETAIVKKVYTKDDLNENGDIIISFESKDTEKLLPGTYYYEVKLVYKKDNEEFVNTVVIKNKFILLD